MNYCITIILLLIFVMMSCKNSSNIEGFKSMPVQLLDYKQCKRYFKKLNLLDYNPDQHINYTLMKIFIPDTSSNVLEYDVNLGLFSYYNYISENFNNTKNVYLKTDNRELYKSLKLSYRTIRDEFLPKGIRGIIGLSSFKNYTIRLINNRSKQVTLYNNKYCKIDNIPGLVFDIDTDTLKLYKKRLLVKVKLDSKYYCYLIFGFGFPITVLNKEFLQNIKKNNSKFVPSKNHSIDLGKFEYQHIFNVCSDKQISSRNLFDITGLKKIDNLVLGLIGNDILRYYTIYLSYKLKKIVLIPKQS